MTDVLGLGAPMVDHIYQVDEPFLKTLPGKKGDSTALSKEDFLRIEKSIGKAPVDVMGGSAANTIKGLSQLGYSTSFVGSLGDDVTGQMFARSLGHTIPFFKVVQDELTGQTLCFVTPDGERTFCSYLGGSYKLTPEDLPEAAFTRAKLIHIEGYAFLRKGVIPRAIELAKQQGAFVSLDLSNASIVTEHKDEVLSVLPYVDILFADENEAKAVVGKDGEEGCRRLKELVPKAVLHEGVKGCWVGDQSEVAHFEAYPIKPVDTTGAGDLFICGFLHGFLNKQKNFVCAKWGALTAREVVKVIGAEIPAASWLRLQEEFKNGTCTL